MIGMKIIDARGISKSFKDIKEDKPVLNHVDFSMEEGEFVAVMGPSGSGKTTLLFCVSGMDTVDSGRVLFLNRSLSECGERTF